MIHRIQPSRRSALLAATLTVGLLQGSAAALSPVPASPNVGSSTQVQLEPARDNTIFEDAAGGISNGSGDFVIAGNTGQSKTRRALLAFDVAGSVPAGSTITGATLTLTLRQTSTGPHAVNAHRASADWGEGASVAGGGNGAPAATDDATWLHTFFPTSLWQNVGGDFSAAISATATVDQAGAYGWSSAALTADVQDMLDNPAGNHGWFLLSDESQAQTTKLFGSRESSLVSERPVLSIDYVPGPTSYCTAGTSGSGCTATLSAVGIPSLSASSGFALTGSDVEGTAKGFVFFGRNGRLAQPWQGTSSYLCVRPPVLRTPMQDAGGTAGSCDGSLGIDLNAFWANRPGRRPSAGDTIQTQAWYRASANRGLSDALEFTVCP